MLRLYKGKREDAGLKPGATKKATQLFDGTQQVAVLERLFGA
jgi:hypothetical protein